MVGVFVEKIFSEMFRRNRYRRKIKLMLKVLSKINPSSPQSIFKLILGSNFTKTIDVGVVIDLCRGSENKYGNLPEVDILTKLLVK